jgi:hypothetical protein
MLIISIISLIIMLIGSIVCANLIISYLKSKPPWLQTFNDCLMIELQYVFAHVWGIQNQ